MAVPGKSRSHKIPSIYRRAVINLVFFAPKLLCPNLVTAKLPACTKILEFVTRISGRAVMTTISRRSVQRGLRLLGVLLAGCAILLAGAAPSAAQTTLRIGHFPNITHVQALVAHYLSRQGKGWFEQRLGPNVKIEWYVYNAGPSAMEAIFAKSIDLTYVGPNPAINAYAKSRGQEVRIVAGAVNGG